MWFKISVFSCVTNYLVIIHVNMRAGFSITLTAVNQGSLKISQQVILRYFSVEVINQVILAILHLAI